MGLFGKSASHKNNDQGHEALLDQELYKVPSTNTSITWADAIEGTLITGSTGSGKSSGPGRHIALAMLKNGFGMCVLCAKKDESSRWLKYAEETNRLNDVIHFNKKSGLKFSFLEHEMTRLGEGAGDNVNLINSLMNLNEQNRIHQAGGEGKDERFWDNALRRLISRIISLLRLSGQEISITNMRKVVANCFLSDEPTTYENLKKISSTPENIDPAERKHAKETLDVWIKANYFLGLVSSLEKKSFPTDDEDDEKQMVLDYWLKELPKLSERTTSIILESFNGIIEPFLNRGVFPILCCLFISYRVEKPLPL